MQSILEKNLVALQQKESASLYTSYSIEELATTKVGKFITRFSNSPNVINTFSIQNNNETPIYSGDISAEINGALDRVANKKPSHVINLGLGFGLLASEILAKYNSEIEVIIIEPDVDIFISQLTSIDFSALLSNKMVSIFVDPNPNNVADILSRIIDVNKANFRSWMLSFAPFTNALSTEFLTPFTNRLRTVLWTNVARFNTPLIYAMKDIENYYNNLKELNHSFQLSEPIKAPDKPVLIIAAGPSLEPQLNNLKKYRDKFLILAMGVTIKMLHKYDIHPDFVVALDPIDISGEALKSDHYQNEILVAAINSSDIGVHSFPGRKVLFMPHNFKKDEFVKHNINLISLEAGGTVAHTCLSFAKLLNAVKIVFLGQDLALVDGRSHIQGHMDLKEYSSSDLSTNTNLHKVKSYNDDFVYTSSDFHAFRLWIEDFITWNHEVEFVNCSQGAYINGAQHIDFLTLASNTPSSNGDDLIELTQVKISNLQVAEIINSAKSISNAISKSASRYLTAAKKLKFNNGQYTGMLEVRDALQKVSDLVINTPADTFFGYGLQPLTITLTKAYSSDVPLDDLIKNVTHNVRSIYNFSRTVSNITGARSKELKASGAKRQRAN